ncbi:Cd(II), Zn(II) and Co(II) exporter (ATPase) [Petrocella atlantisensis]|uniref:Cd(II), Zn(II) and Co(II) exporter (ATPase) n=1 Tax=Petrocella atlantisensis TaxID=2173034 RepID=A0A3P7Q0J2_9FIRM|nr:heavy metal translocating P-type ATPase [Petrocella atlantisensis]VDN49257.1 Cd(II), Zn(II) and Co(II) exporter (ATPase) [Petrocella atlantisensis]
MSSTIKKELILEGLDCASCAAKIEDGVSKLDHVSLSSVNFVTKTLTIDVLHSGDIDLVMNDTTALVAKLEPDVIVKEKVISKAENKTLMLMGLSCASCAAKIENEVKSIDGVMNATVDFVSKKLIIEAKHKRELPRIVEQATIIAVGIESDLKVVDTDEYNSKDGKEKGNHEEDGINKVELIRLGTGFVLFLVGLLLEFTPIIELSVFLTSYLLVGGSVVLKALKNISRGQVFDENFLIGVATIGAFAIGEYPEGVAVMLFYQVGEFFQSMAVNHSRRSISALMDIRPDFANLKIGDNVEKVSPEDVAIGDTIIIKPGEKVPLDGKVISGSSMLDTSAITGESVPREVEPGHEILSGTINKNGVLTVLVSKEFGESTVSKILDLVQNASSKKAPTENFITKFARYYTPVVVFIALALAIMPPLFIPGATYNEWIYRALVFLVVSCPCALVISIPLGFFGGIGGASKAGILMKGSNYLEALNSVDTVVFDKTGTLTKGVFKVTKIVNLSNDLSDDELLEFAAYTESYSNHPIAQSILKAYKNNIDKNMIDDYDEISGYGIQAKVKGRTVLAGNLKLMNREKIAFDESTSKDEVGTIIHMVIDQIYSGYIVISDEIKEDSKRAILELRKQGVKNLVMLTGDNKSIGEKIGQQLGLDEVYSELLPHEKVEKLEMLESREGRKGKLVFVGDGINDAPVLTRADIGIAMGGIGSDAAIEAADVVIMTDEPSKIPSAIRISKRTKAIVWQNIIFAFAVKGIVLILGAGGLATMWEAVFADVGVAVLAVFNAMRVLKSKSH